MRALDPDPAARPDAREIARLVAGLVTPNPAFRAPHLVAQARFLARRRGPHLGGAQERFERAVEIDPQHAPAHAGIAEMLCRRAQRGDVPDPFAGQRAVAAAERALGLDPSLAEAHVARALCDLVFRGELPAARSRLERALALDDTRCRARIESAVLAVRAGALDEALDHALRAVGAVPGDSCAWRALGWTRLVRGESEAARIEFRRAVDLADSDEDRAALARATRTDGGVDPAAVLG